MFSLCELFGMLNELGLGDNNLVMFTYFRIPGMSLDDCLVPLMVDANVIKIIELYLWYNVVSSSGKDLRLLEWPVIVFEPTNDVNVGYLDCENETPGDIHEKFQHAGDIHKIVQETLMEMMMCSNKIVVDAKLDQSRMFADKFWQEFGPGVLYINELPSGDKCDDEQAPQARKRILWFMRYIERKKDTRKFLIRSIEEGLYKMKQIPATNTTVTRLQTEDDLTGDDLKHYKADIEAIDIDFSTTE
ncbi:hypothetical protein Tco_1218579 [Tanacetum coccineum]